ncbi:hypothetical protein CMO92_02670 [Candidatus Woesearchaeota archaeon]|nr:hypothetical protein [Candidatus Woesearchaeota archaeon]|tara:strand:+ start:302 stop:781 length:480 start_codon:yes stop_codon:yes gene_type:complete
MNKKQLLGFIAKAHRNTYAAPQEIKSKYRCKKPIQAEHKDYDFIDGDWRYHDSYAGISWAPGREVVFLKNKPVWCMSYQGQTIGDLSDDFIDETFEFLKKALRKFTKEIPFRGLDGFEEGDFKYTFTFKGDYTYFIGRESVFYKEKEIFFQDIMATLIK